MHSFAYEQVSIDTKSLDEDYCYYNNDGNMHVLSFIFEMLVKLPSMKNNTDVCYCL